MSDYENEDECWSTLESFRVKLISVIDPSRITPYLRQCKVLNPDDEEQVLSDPNLVIRKRKVGKVQFSPPAGSGPPAPLKASLG
jgi:caspase recruitment domain-containing protein 9